MTPHVGSFIILIIRTVDQREENPKTSHENLINFFAGLHERAALPEKLPGDAKDETRDETAKENARRESTFESASTQQSPPRGVGTQRAHS